MERRAFVLLLADSTAANIRDRGVGSSWARPYSSCKKIKVGAKNGLGRNASPSLILVFLAIFLVLGPAPVAVSLHACFIFFAWSRAGRCCALRRLVILKVELLGEVEGDFCDGRLS